MLMLAALVKPFPADDRPENPQASVFNCQGHGILCCAAAFGGWQCALCCHLLGTSLWRTWREVRLGQSNFLHHPRQQHMVGLGVPRVEIPAFLTLMVWSGTWSM